MVAFKVNLDKKSMDRALSVQKQSGEFCLIM